MVIELFEPGAGPNLEAGGQAAGQWLALDDGHAAAALRKSQPRGQPERARTKDGSTPQQTLLKWPRSILRSCQQTPSFWEFAGTLSGRHPPVVPLHG
jgi:hypothetical protein